MRQFPLALTAPFVATDERMKPEARQIHILWPRRVVECSQYIGYPLSILNAEPAPVSGREKPFKGLVPKRADHLSNVRQ
jgi:hypothetical protein